MLGTSGCGTLLYPERSGQQGGRLDPTVVILDSVGVLFYIIPGLLAFAIDFANGTIYLPGSKQFSLDAPGVRRVALDGPITKETVAAIVEREFDVADVFDHERLVVSSVR